jgi:hypothetical protein
MNGATPYGRQLLRDERYERIHRILALNRESHTCFKAKAYDAALAIQFIELDSWAFLTRPESIRVHGRKSFMLFIERFLQDAPNQGYFYRPIDVYAARCGLLHTFGSLADLHSGTDVVVWRYHLGRFNTFVPGMNRMAYISTLRFMMDCSAATGRALDAVWADPVDMGRLFGERLPRLFMHGGVLPSRDPEAMPALEAAVDAEIAEVEARAAARGE